MKILSIAWKDNLLRFTDRTEILFFLILPLVFTYLLSGGAGQPSFEGIPLVVVDADGSELSGALIMALSKGDTLQPEVVSADEAARRYETDQATAWLTIPAGFEADLLAGREGRLDLRRTPENAQADAAERAVRAAISEVNRSVAAAQSSTAEAEQARPFASAAERQAYFSHSLAAARLAFEDAPERVAVTRPESDESGGTYDQATQASSGQLITWVMIPLLGTSALFAIERRLKTLPRLLTMPVSRGTVLLGPLAGQLIAALFQMALLIGFGALVLGVDYGRSVAGLAVMAVAFALASVALGTMLGSFIKTEKQANNLAILLGMVLALLGGCWWPIELFPPIMRTAALALPTTWAMQGFTDLALRGAGLVEILPAAAALLGFAAVFFLVGVKQFRFE